MKEIYLLNGKIKKASEINLLILKRGFLFGDGIFETLISKNYKIFRFSDHYKRLKKGAKICNFEVPEKDKVEKLILRNLKSQKIKNGYIRINVWRKKGERSMPEGKEVNILIIIKNYKPYPSYLYQNGMKCIISKKIFKNEKSLLYKIKSFNFLENILGKIEAKENDCQDVIFLNTKGFLTEGTVSNLFFVKEDKIYTPSVECGILSGITRKIVIQVCRKNRIEIKEGKFKPEFLKECDEVFMTNTLMGIMPVERIGNFFKKKKAEMVEFIKDGYLKILKEETYE